MPVCYMPQQYLFHFPTLCPLVCSKTAISGSPECMSDLHPGSPESIYSSSSSLEKHPSHTDLLAHRAWRQNMHFERENDLFCQFLNLKSLQKGTWCLRGYCCRLIARWLDRVPLWEGFACFSSQNMHV